jgi:transcriptional regulator with XRE-family HTH domain
METVELYSPGQLLKDARLRRGVSQKRLAIRAGTTQSAISRIEKDRVSPTVETLRALLHMLGEDLILASVERDAGIDRSMTRERLKQTSAERVEYGLEFARMIVETHEANRPGVGPA